MRAVLDKSLARHHQNENEKLEHLKKEHKKFIRAPSDNSITNILHLFGKAVETYSRTEVSTLYCLRKIVMLHFVAFR